VSILNPDLAPNADDLYVTFTRSGTHGQMTGIGYAILTSMAPITSAADIVNLERHLLRTPETAHGATSITVLSWQRWEQ
jgi:hypothetical protein